MKMLRARSLAEWVTDRPRGSRMQFVTGLTPEDGERALYKKGGEIALQIWLNVDLRERIAGGYVDNIRQMQEKLEQVPEAKLVFAPAPESGELPTAFIIGDIKAALAVLTEGNDCNITPIAGRTALNEFDDAQKQKTAMDAAAHTLGGKKTPRPRVKPPEEEDA